MSTHDEGFGRRAGPNPGSQSEFAHQDFGAGPDVDGQILVLHDILNISPTVTLGRKPRFVRNFMDGAKDIETAIGGYVKAVKDRSYPAPEHCF